MPARKKVRLVSSEDTVDTTPLAPQELSETKTEKSVRPKRKPVQPKEIMESKAIETIETTEQIEATEPLIKVVAAELDMTPTQEAKTPVLQGEINKKLRKETHTKEKFYIRNDLLETIKALTKIKGKSFKTNFINDALEKSLNELEATKE
jgi:hypothetical protein